ncbi:hypothetical protein SAMN05216327_1202 [Dyadobacter sp. SG02]|nr:hypothetical protein SAMN05216327_1202 [Dyadobacter sp. SG02]
MMDDLTENTTAEILVYLFFLDDMEPCIEENEVLESVDPATSFMYDYLLESDTLALQ